MPASCTLAQYEASECEGPECGDMSTPLSPSSAVTSRSAVSVGFSKTHASGVSWSSRSNTGATYALSASLSMKKRITFSNPDLLRGTSASVVLRRFGRILKESAGSSATHALSSTVQSIDVFVSHNWSTPRLAKFLTLALHFNLNTALLATVAVSVILVVLTLLDILPLYEVEGFIVGDYDDNFIVLRRGPYCTVAGSLVFLFAFLFAHECRPRCGFQSPKVFLDKVCINQVDDKVKQEGIESLAAFIRYSRRMLVVYSDIYLLKLWTIYELASFLVLHRSANMIVVPTFIPKLVLVGTFVWTGFMTAHEFITVSQVEASQILFYVVTVGIGLPAMLAVSSLLRHWAREQARIYSSVEKFSISDAMCFNESDRVVVQCNVAKFMICLGRASPSATVEEALSEFDALVKVEVPTALVASFGRVGLPYRHVMTMGLGFSLGYADLCCGWLLSEISMRYCLTGVLLGALLQFAVVPLDVALASYLTRRALHLRGVAEWSLVAASTLGTFAFGVGLFSALQQLRAMAESSDVAFALYLLLAFLLIVVTYIIYRPSGLGLKAALGEEYSYQCSRSTTRSVDNTSSQATVASTAVALSTSSGTSVACAAVPAAPIGFEFDEGFSIA